MDNSNINTRNFVDDKLSLAPTQLLLRDLPVKIEMLCGTETPESLRAQIKDITRRCFVPTLHDFLCAGWDGVFNEPSSLVLTATENKQCIAAACALQGVNLARLKGTPYYDLYGVYLAIGMVLPEYRRMSIYQHLSLARLQAALSPLVEVVFVRTQNAAVFDAATASLESLVNRGAISGYSLAYTRLEKGTYGTLVTHGSPCAPSGDAHAFDPDMDVQNGDVMLFVWRISHPDANSEEQDISTLENNCW